MLNAIPGGEGFDRTFLRLIWAVRRNTPEEDAHCIRVGHLSRMVGQRLGLDSREADLLFRAAPFHDLAKAATPKAIIEKPGPLTAEEWSIVKRHPQIGADWISGAKSSAMRLAREIALTHHERADGTGYPLQLSGETIPMSGRIVTIADQYDALRSARPYKPAFDHDKTCRIILEGDDRTRPEHFDPKILKIFREFHRDFDAIFDPHPVTPYTSKSRL